MLRVDLAIVTKAIGYAKSEIVKEDQESDNIYN